MNKQSETASLKITSITLRQRSKGWSWLENFFFKPASAKPLAALRIGLSGILIIQAFWVRSSVLDFFSTSGLVQGDLANYLSSPYTPKISWLSNALISFNISETFSVYFVCSMYFVSLLLLFLGLWTPIVSVVVWFLHWTLVNTGYTSAYGVDLYAHIFLFYLMFVPSAGAWSIDSIQKREWDTFTPRARLGLRVMQIHLCLSYLSSGLDKAQGSQWWNGELLWRAFSLPVYRQFDMSWLAQWPWLSRIGGWTTLVVELGYFIFIWPKATRKFWIAATVALHLGIAIFLGLGLFGIIMCVLTLALFGVSSEPEITLETQGKAIPDQTVVELWPEISEWEVRPKPIEA